MDFSRHIKEQIDQINQTKEDNPSENVKIMKLGKFKYKYHTRRRTLTVPFYNAQFQTYSAKTLYTDENFQTKYGRAAAIQNMVNLISIESPDSSQENFELLLNIGFTVYRQIESDFSNAKFMELYVVKNHNFVFNIAEKGSNILDGIFDQLPDYKSKILFKLKKSICEKFCKDCYPLSKPEFKQFLRKGANFDKDLVLRLW